MAFAPQGLSFVFNITLRQAALLWAVIIPLLGVMNTTPGMDESYSESGLVSYIHLSEEVCGEDR